MGAKLGPFKFAAMPQLQKALFGQDIMCTTEYWTPNIFIHLNTGLFSVPYSNGKKSLAWSDHVNPGHRGLDFETLHEI